MNQPFHEDAEAVELLKKNIAGRMIVRCRELESKLVFWRLVAIGMVAVCIIITAIKCQH